MSEQHQLAHRVRECAERLAGGEVAALASLFDLTSQRLLRYALALTRHQSDAEDAIQSALVGLAGHPSRLATAQCPWSYLLRMVRNECLLLLRRKQRCGTSGDLSDLVTHCPVDELEREESHRSVWRALRLLPAEQAEVVVLKIWEEMTFAQIGQLLDVSPHTAASRYQYGIDKLTRRLIGEQREVRRD